jgi:hypothetical protein
MSNLKRRATVFPRCEAEDFGDGWYIVGGRGSRRLLTCQKAFLLVKEKASAIGRVGGAIVLGIVCNSKLTIDRGGVDISRCQRKRGSSGNTLQIDIKQGEEWLPLRHRMIVVGWLSLA